MLSLSAEALLDKFAHGTPVPGAGPAAAFVTAFAAALSAMAARSSFESWADAPAAVAQAESLRARVVRLAQEDAEALEAFLAVRYADEEHRPEARDFNLGQALDRAAEIPLAIAEAACDIAQLAAHVADHCEGDVRADAASAAALAAGAARAAAHLVEVNLGMAEGDVRVVSARNLVRLAQDTADVALSGVGHSE